MTKKRRNCDAYLTCRAIHKRKTYEYLPNLPIYNYNSKVKSLFILNYKNNWHEKCAKDHDKESERASWNRKREN